MKLSTKFVLKFGPNFRAEIFYSICFATFFTCDFQGVLDAARRSDKSGEWENVETFDELSIETLRFEAEMARYAEMVDQLQIQHVT